MTSSIGCFRAAASCNSGAREGGKTAEGRRRRALGAGGGREGGGDDGGVCSRAELDHLHWARRSALDVLAGEVLRRIDESGSSDARFAVGPFLPGTASNDATRGPLLREISQARVGLGGASRAHSLLLWRRSAIVLSGTRQNTQASGEREGGRSG